MFSTGESGKLLLLSHNQLKNVTGSLNLGKMKFHILLNLAPAISHTTNRPDIKENIARGCRTPKHFIFMASVEHEIEYC